MWWMFLASTALAKPVDLTVELDAESQYQTEVTVKMNAGAAEMDLQVGTIETIEEGGAVGTDQIVYLAKVEYVALKAKPPGATEMLEWDSRGGQAPPQAIADAAKVLNTQFRVRLSADMKATVEAVGDHEPPKEALGLVQALQAMPSGSFDIGESAKSGTTMSGRPIPVDWVLETHKKKVASLVCTELVEPNGTVNCKATIDTKRDQPRHFEISATQGEQVMYMAVDVAPAK